MGYSKRWELIHILGGKCVDCNNENFYDWELDNDDIRHILQLDFDYVRKENKEIK
jgi:hypothetical protein